MACRRCPPGGKIRILTENARKMAVLGRLLVLFGWNSGPVAVLCVSGSLSVNSRKGILITSSKFHYSIPVFRLQARVWPSLVILLECVSQARVPALLIWEASFCNRLLNHGFKVRCFHLAT